MAGRKILLDTETEKQIRILVKQLNMLIAVNPPYYIIKKQ
jgi:hypothetical protein